MTSGHVVLVDTYAPTKRLAPAFADAGYTPVRVQSTRDVPALYRGGHDPYPYTADITHRGDVAETAAALEPYRPAAVVAGGEIGVNLADALSERLQPLFGGPTNGTALSPARRDKYAMVEAVKTAGLRGADQIAVRDEDHLREWHTSLGRRIILKPRRSAAGDGVRWCSAPEDSVAAYRELTGRTNIFSEDDGVIAQEYLVGAEYLVNTVSRDGRHHVCDIWKTHRISLNGVRDLVVACHLLPRRGRLQDRLAAYGSDVLDALGIRHGPAHTEIKADPRGPCVVEVGARICGLDLPGYAREAIGESQLEWTVDAYVRPDRFSERCGLDYRLRTSVAWAAMAAPFGGTLRAYRGLDAVKELESFQDLTMFVEPGDRLRPTVDDSTYPMAVSLKHEVDEIVLRDLRTLRYIDGAGFYDAAPDTGEAGA